MANLHLVTGFSGSAHVTAADHGSLNAALFGAGKYVLNRGNKFRATVISNNCVRIANGDILFQGRHIRMSATDYVDLTIESGKQGYNRNDLIVCRYTQNTSSGKEECNLVVIKGTASTGTASDPSYFDKNILDGNAKVDFPLYRIPISGLTIGTPVPLFTIVDSYSDYVAGEADGFKKKFGTDTVESNRTITKDDNGKILGVSRDVYLSFPSLSVGMEVTVFRNCADRVAVAPIGDAKFAVPGSVVLEDSSTGLVCYIPKNFGCVTLRQINQGIWIIQGDVTIGHEGG